MSIIVKQDSNGVKPLLQVGELGYDNFPVGGDVGRVYVGTGTSNIAQAKKSEVTAVDSKVDTHVARVDNPHGVTKAQVGLGNADDTSDADKPISIATQDALDLKANADSAVLTGIPTATTANVGTDTTQLATTAFVKAEVASEAYSKTELDAGQLDDRYFTEIELLDGALDSRYYTETEIDTKLAEQYVDGKYSGFKNYIINGGFDIDQRNNKVGFTIAAGGNAFSADRWVINNTTNQPVSITVANYPTPSGSIVGRLRIKFDTAPTSGVVQVVQRIENVGILAGKQVTLSQSFACDAMTIINDATQNFGSGGSSNVITGFSNINTTGTINSLTRFSNSITMPSVDGKTIGAGSYTQITYNLPIRTTNIQTITQVQLEEGSVATPFENRPIGLELSLCQRYFENGFFAVTAGTIGTGVTLATNIVYKNTKRISPTVSYFGVTYTNCSSITTNLNTTVLVAPAINVSSGGYAYATGTYNASAEL